MTTTTDKPRRRADAERNDVRLIDAARTAFSAAGDPNEVALSRIAAAAGLGQGTLYRHFPTREALLLAVYRTDVEELVAAAPALLAEREPIDALRGWLEVLADYGRVKRSLAQIVENRARGAIAAEWRPPVIAAIAELLDACKATGAIRPDLVPDDVIRLFGFLWSGDADDDWRERSARLTDITFEGLKASRLDEDARGQPGQPRRSRQ